MMKNDEWRRALDIGHRMFEVEGRKTSEIDGKSKQSAKAYIQNKLNKTTKGFFRDTGWQNIRKKVWDVLDSMDLEWYIVETKYRTENNIPVAKEWTIEIEFINNKDKVNKISGHVTASGAGSVEDPLDRYDIVVYFW